MLSYFIRPVPQPEAMNTSKLRLNGDVSSFLQGDLKEDVYIEQLGGFQVSCRSSWNRLKLREESTTYFLEKDLLK